MSGHIRSQKRSKSSAVLTTTVSSRLGTAKESPWASFAPPTPPASATIMNDAPCRHPRIDWSFVESVGADAVDRHAERNPLLLAERIGRNLLGLFGSIVACCQRLDVCLGDGLVIVHLDLT